MTPASTSSSVHDGQDESLGIPMASWAETAINSGRGYLLEYVKSYAKENKLEFRAPYHTLHHPLHHRLSPRESTEQITAALSAPEVQILSTLQLAKVMPLSLCSRPYTTPDGYCESQSLRYGVTRIFPIAGSAWRLVNPEKTCTYISQAGIAVRQMSYDTLVSQPSKANLGLNATATHDFGSKPLDPLATPDERHKLRQAYGTVLRTVKFRTGYYNVQSMVKDNLVDLAAKFVEDDFDHAMSAADSLRELGWTMQRFTLIRDEDGKMTA